MHSLHSYAVKKQSHCNLLSHTGYTYLYTGTLHMLNMDSVHSDIEYGPSPLQ